MTDQATDDTKPSSCKLLQFDGQSSSEKQYDFEFALPLPPVPPVTATPMEVDAQTPLLLPEQIFQGTPGSAKKVKLNNGKERRKLRRLTSERVEHCGDAILNEPKIYRLFRLRSMALFSVTILLMAVGTNENLRRDFIKRSRKYCQLLLYGAEDYCSQEMDLTNITMALETRIVGQSDAIRKVVNFMNEQRHQPYSAIAFTGPVGSGKTLMASVIAEKFQWHLNVHHIFLDISNSAENRYLYFQTQMHSLRDKLAAALGYELSCGHNLLIFDQLESNDVQLVNKINKRLEQICSIDRAQITALFVFQGYAVKDDTALAGLSNNIEQVHFRTLDVRDLTQCVKREAKMVGLELGDDSSVLKEIIERIDVEHHGCKSVSAKLRLYS